MQPCFIESQSKSSMLACDWKEQLKLILREVGWLGRWLTGILTLLRRESASQFYRWNTGFGEVSSDTLACALSVKAHMLDYS